jgi:hypothetical protein
MHLKANEIWVAYFDEQYTRISNAEAFYSFQFYPKSKIIFEQLIHQEYIDGAYPNWSEKQILKDQINNLSKLKLIVIFSDQKSLFKGIPNNFSASRRITFGLMKHLEKNSNWTLYKTLHTLKYGNLAFYTRNDS